MGFSPDTPGTTRRRLLQSAGGCVGGGLAGCLTTGGVGSGSDPDPIDLSGDKLDYHGGMRIGMHGGPNGQIFYAEQDPEPMGDGGTAADGPDGVAWFHTLVRGLFPYHFRRVDRGWTADVIYITDYSAVDWELFEREGDRYMPSPTDPETFGDATELTYVAESSVLGGMGPDLIPFSADRDADAFIDDHGGRTVAFGDIDRALIRGIRRSGDR